MKDKLNIFLIFLTTIISRLPFIWNSPGLDPDNWRVLAIGKQIAATGIYNASRLPGYPISEYTASFFGDNSWWVLNIITLLFTAFAMTFFYKILAFFELKNKLITTLALSFTSAIFISSTTNMEYLWSLFFLIAAIFTLLKRKFILGGILLGIMIATRFTNIVFLAPILYLLIGIINEKKIINVFKVYISTFLSFIICFIPVFEVYGINIFPENGSEDVDLKSIISYFTLFLYGVLGILGIIISSVFIIKNKSEVKILIQRNRKLIIFCFLMIALTSIIFLKFPYESYYNLPLIPFLIILLNICLYSAKVKNLVFCLFIISPFLFNASSSKLQLKGSAFVIEKMENDFSNNSIRLFNNFKSKSDDKKLLVAGGFQFIILYKYFLPKNIKIYKTPTLPLLQYYISKGYKIYYPQDARNEVLKKHNYDITKYGESILPPIIYDR